jgi:hypothetical protein
VGALVKRTVAKAAAAMPTAAATTTSVVRRARGLAAGSSRSILSWFNSAA